MAVLRETGTKEKDALMYNKGKTVPGGAKVLRVDPRRVYVLNQNRVEYIEMEGAQEPKKAAEPVAAVTVGGDPLDTAVQRGVKCSGPSCEIERGLVDNLLSNTAQLATAARFVPSVKDGRPNGFKLYAIRPSSIFGKIGLQNGDTVKSINGMEMSSPDQALGIYTKLRSASHLTVQVERHGENVTLDYTIR
jgi:general secretion pathway protein C